MLLARLNRNRRLWLTVLLMVAGGVAFHVRVGRRMPDFQVYHGR